MTFLLPKMAETVTVNLCSVFFLHPHFSRIKGKETLLIPQDTTQV